MSGLPSDQPLQTQTLTATAAPDMATAVALLRAGRLVAVPTETVYGLAADARQATAVAGIFRAKQRPDSHPLIVHIADASALPDWARDIPDSARQLAAAFWPGPLTLLLHKAAAVPAVVTGGLPAIGLRVPAHPVLLQVLRQLDTGLAAPSANLHKQLSPTSAAQVLAGLEGRIDAVLDGGICPVGLESTIVDLTQDTPRILRAGPITRTQLETVLGTAVASPEQHEVSVPGNVAEHYRPRTPLYRGDATRLERALQAAPASLRLGLVTHGQSTWPKTAANLQQLVLPTEPADYASRLYYSLFTLDNAQLDAILLESPPATEAWAAINDRLRRAAMDQQPPWLRTE